MYNKGVLYSMVVGSPLRLAVMCDRLTLECELVYWRLNKEQKVGASILNSVEMSHVKLNIAHLGVNGMQ